MDPVLSHKSPSESRVNPQPISLKNASITATPTTEGTKQTAETKEKVPRTRKKREIAPFACQTCHRKKVKCDLVTKNPHEKCSTCVEFGVECVLKKRRKKRTRDQIEADRLREERGEPENNCQVQFKFEQPIEIMLAENEKQKRSKPKKPKMRRVSNTTTKTTANTANTLQFVATTVPSSSSSVSPPKTAASTLSKAETSQNKTSTSTPTTTAPILSSSSSSPLFINKKLFMSRKIDCNKSSAFFRELHNCNSLPCLSMDTRFTPGDLINKQTLTSLEVNGCFQLPSPKDCQLYIDAYFENHELMMSVF
ncbi:unnamed protein product [Ambrosiozyma monospora]|uniref:Unnamed protein product n=1 Tax=Ambrosiozyma monospora TaxID=43982 RepID=A0ACB5TCP3_AMBMO|nr:unnamed protein product [Ambrosiozyma monospora]